METDSIEYFPLFLRKSLLNLKLTPSYIFEKVGVSEKTVLNWMRGDATPQPINVWKISQLTPKLGTSLLVSYMLCYRMMFYITPREGRSVLSDVLERITARTDTLKLSDTDLLKYLESWYAAHKIAEKTTFSIQSEKTLTIIEDQIIKIPTPNIEIIERWQEIAKHISKDSAIMYDMNWKAFEDLIGGLLESHGWEINHQGYTKDGGVDLIAARLIPPSIPINMLVQCKRHKKTRKVGVQVVREIWAVKWTNAFHQAMIATTSGFTKGAKEQANQWNMELSDHNTILDWCRNVGRIIT